MVVTCLYFLYGSVAGSTKGNVSHPCDSDHQATTAPPQARTKVLCRLEEYSIRMKRNISLFLKDLVLPSPLTTGNSCQTLPPLSNLCQDHLRTSTCLPQTAFLHNSLSLSRIKHTQSSLYHPATNNEDDKRYVEVRTFHEAIKNGWGDGLTRAHQLDDSNGPLDNPHFTTVWATDGNESTHSLGHTETRHWLVGRSDNDKNWNDYQR